MKPLRNIAIVAHVDHGKTTLVDQLLRQSGTFRENQEVAERVMDSMDLEREKGITIRSKSASFEWGGHIINVVDTPGHADFGGEVERIMKMIDGVLLVVDAYEGPQAQTKFVLRRALEQGAKPLVVINKIDRANARPHGVLDMVFELFMELNASDEQLDFPVIYASAKDGFAIREVDEEPRDLTPLFEAVIEHIPPPPVSEADWFCMLVSNQDHNDYLGRVVHGRITSGSVRVGDTLGLIRRDGGAERAVVTAIFGHSGLDTVRIEEAHAGDIIGLAGFENAGIGDTLADRTDRPALPFTEISPPTIRMRLLVNDSPMAGRSGKFLTARHLRERLVRETRTNISLAVHETDTAGAFEVDARGEMQVAVLVEQMRREGFELMVSRPEVIMQRDDDGNLLEPVESLFLDIPQESLGDILQSLASRRADVRDMEHAATTVAVNATIPTRGLIGFGSELINRTRGTGLISHLFLEYAPWKGPIEGRRSGALIAKEQGTTTAYALESVQERGRLFVGPGAEVYEGMIVGENRRADDLVVNPCKAKHLTNMRSSGDGKGIQLDPPVIMSIEKCIEFLADDEYLEVTPRSLRLRKKILDATARKRATNKAVA